MGESDGVVAGCSGCRGRSEGILALLRLDTGVVPVDCHHRSGWLPALPRLASPLLRLAAVVLPSVGALHPSSLPGTQLGLARHKTGVGCDVFQTSHLWFSLTMPLPEALPVSRAAHHIMFSRCGVHCLPGCLMGSRCCLPALPNWHPLSTELWFPHFAATSLLPEIIT